jgi:acetyl-CoA carboxylase carboxyltransferase component
MDWLPEIEEIARRRALAKGMGGPENVARHKARGKLTVRERLDTLADAGTFEEIGSLAGSATYLEGRLTAVTPSNTLIGLCQIDGRRVMVNAGDFTVRGGASDGSVARKGMWSEKMAIEWHIPFIRLLDAAGGSVRTFEKLGHTYLPTGPGFDVSPHLLEAVPTVAAVLGSVAGLPAVQAVMAHFNVMVKDTSQIFVGGPPVVKAALGQDITKEELGNERVQAHEGGAIDNVAGTEQEAFAMIRRFLSFMPASVWDLPARVETGDGPDRREASLAGIVPRDPKKIYNPRAVLDAVLDRGSVFEIGPFHGRSRITALARVNGYPVGAMINDCRYLGGAMDVAAAEKATRFVELCETFHLPIVYFADEPGFMVGLESEKRGMLRAGARLHAVMASTRTPWFTFIVRQLFGVAGGCHIRLSGMYRRVAWPSGNWGSMHIEGGADAAYRREIEAAPDPKAKRSEIMARLNALASPFRTAETFGVEEIIDPRDSRPLLCQFVAAAQPVLHQQIGPGHAPRYRP